jgi:3-phenylpropionate/trans-cinnamate dioxygenase ferredoxin reductase component
VGAERHPPYERPPVSKGILAGSVTPESAYLRAAGYYAEKNVTLRLGVRIEAIDREARVVHLAAGEPLPYDVLVLTTGARARTLPMADVHGAGIHYIRDIDDALALRGSLGPGRRLAVIGAGFIGLEVAAVARTLGCDFVVFEAAERILARSLPGEIAAFVQALHLSRGVTFHLGTMLAGIERIDRTFTVKTGAGEEFVADAVVVGVGAIPNVELAAACGIDVDNGVVVDEYGRTSDPHIYAAGDVTSHYNPLLRRRLRLECWQNAQNQAVAVAHAIAGSGAAYAEVPWFWTDQYDCNLQLAGVPDRWDRIVWRGDPSEGRFVAFLQQEGRVVAGCAVNSGRDMRFVKRLVAAEAIVNASELGDSNVALGDLGRVG